MPTFIKTGYWEKIQKGYNGWLNLDNLIASSVGTGTSGQITYWGSSGLTGSNSLFWDNTNKRMGIGTDTPLTTAANYTVLALNNIIGGVLEFQSNGTRIATINNNNLQLDIETKIAGPITFGTNSSERMRIDSAGNVGIGTNAPVGKLDVVSDGGGQMFFSRYGGQPQINIRRSQGTFAVPTAVVNGASSVLNFQNYNGTAFATSAQIQSVPTTQSATDAGATLALNVVQGLTTTMTNGLIVSGNNATAGAISITNAFNGPSARLTIWQSTLNTTLDYFDIVNSGGGQLLRFFNNGNLVVGGNANSTFKLDVAGTIRGAQYNLSALNTAPASATATGTLGEIRIDANHIYVCTATNTWKRVAIATW